MNRAGEGFLRVGYRSSIKNKHEKNENEPRFNGVYSRDNLPDKVKGWAYIINLDERYDIGTHWIALYATNNNVTYFDSFAFEHIPKEIIIFIDKSIAVTNIFIIQAYDSIMCR